jgi:hypothetical protein
MLVEPETPSRATAQGDPNVGKLENNESQNV